MTKEPLKFKKKGVRRMATQLQATPTLYGRDAEEVRKQLEKKPTEKSKEKARRRKALFEGVGKRGLP